MYVYSVIAKLNTL